uniref:Uncharacterized protein ORF-c20_027 n=1 Tax=Saccharolobus solfataricus TaxID=2287 RepID=Q9UXC3_SACSO|nr:hypothetical protein [Saccharolobus solfataricus P2]
MVSPLEAFLSPNFSSMNCFILSVNPFICDSFSIFLIASIKISSEKREGQVAHILPLLATKILHPLFEVKVSYILLFLPITRGTLTGIISMTIPLLTRPRSLPLTDKTGSIDLSKFSILAIT